MSEINGLLHIRKKEFAFELYKTTNIVLKYLVQKITTNIVLKCLVKKDNCKQLNGRGFSSKVCTQCASAYFTKYFYT